ncbi:MAG: septum formation protein Maf [Ignavibacteriales bacterium]|nr:septum formation protein Maf [Ignavibacteriales bacterium]
MTPINLPLILASKSPRRRKLLRQLRAPVEFVDVEFHEETRDRETPRETALRLALEKSEQARGATSVGSLITADTVVALAGETIGKPADEEDARTILRKLSGETHTVFTGFCVHDYASSETVAEVEETRVTFRRLSDEEIAHYVADGSPMDKAGAYGIQDDFGAVFVERIEGCYYNVVGLPLARLYAALKRLGTNGRET